MDFEVGQIGNVLEIADERRVRDGAVPEVDVRERRRG